ncbi:MAG: ABC transporter permease [Candidatus Hydrogenedentes bacterium]|nr:ABC transporter permease [Candidatus Hydrogenedentota bacterium]
MNFVLPAWALVKREFVTTLRRTRSFLILVLFVAACIAVVLVAYPEGERLMMQASAVSHQVVMTLSMVFMAACALFVPALAGISIVGEREQETFDLLQVTLIRPSGIILAKLINTVGFFVLLLVASLPIFGVTFFLVGLSWTEIFQMAGIIMATTTSCAMAGIWASARFRKTLTALAGSYLAMLLVMGLWVAIPCLPFAYFLSPVAAIVRINYGGVTGFSYPLAISYHVVLIAVFFHWTLFWLRQPPGPTKLETLKPIDDPAVLMTRRLTFPFYLIDPLRRKKLIEDGRNPMFVRELRWGLMNRGTVLARITYTAAILYFFVGPFVFFVERNTESLVPLILIQITFTVLVAPSLVANAFSKEHELGNMDMLRMTLLSPAEIFLGKVWNGVAGLAPLVLAGFCSILPMLWLVRDYIGLLTGYITFTLCVCLCLSIGTFTSVLTRRSVASIIVAYLIVFMVFIGNSILFPFLEEVLRRLTVSHHAPFLYRHFSANIAWFLSPILAYGMSVNRRDQLQALVHWSVTTVVFIALALSLLAFSLWFFASRRMRDR